MTAQTLQERPGQNGSFPQLMVVILISNAYGSFLRLSLAQTMTPGASRIEQEGDEEKACPQTGSTVKWSTRR